MGDSREHPLPTDAETGSGQSLVEDVLRDAQALLGGPEAEGAAPADAPSAEPEAFDLQSVVDRVDGLLGDFDHLTEEIESVDASAAGLDLTLVLPPRAPEPEDVVPDLGSAGPQVDLFATPAPADPTPEPDVGSGDPTEVVLETESPIETATAAEELLQDLSAALSDEFDRSERSADGSSESPPQASIMESGADVARDATPVSATEVALMAAMTEEFGAEPGDLAPMRDEGDPFESRPETPVEPSDAAKRLEALLAERLAEEYGLVESVSAELASPPEMDGSTDDETSRLQSDIDAVTRAEMAALEALGTDLDADPDRGSGTGDPSSSDAEDDPADPEPSGVSMRASDSMIASSEPGTMVEESSPGDASTDAADRASDAEPITSDHAMEDRPIPVRSGPSALVRLGALPFRVLPARFHRHVTPIAISLAAWVPLAWGYAILAPKPSPPSIDVLPAGLHLSPSSPSETAEAADGTSDANDTDGAASADPVADGRH